jgi:hypothetical protein
MSWAPRRLRSNAATAESDVGQKWISVGAYIGYLRIGRISQAGKRKA